MSYIQETIKCDTCKCEINVATGTFGTGLPEKCPDCGSYNLYKISDGWNAHNKEKE